jgi:hypothetical protein
MSSSRPRLTLDEQAFQGLLAAAFTIQEHNDRNRQKVNATSSPVPGAVPASPLAFCERCGKQLTAGGSGCATCDGEKLRPGERLQRNWASLWLMSQERALWPDRANESWNSTAQMNPSPSRLEDPAQSIPSAVGKVGLGSQPAVPIRIMEEDSSEDDVLGQTSTERQTVSRRLKNLPGNGRSRFDDAQTAMDDDSPVEEVPVPRIQDVSNGDSTSSSSFAHSRFPQVNPTLPADAAEEHPLASLLATELSKRPASTAKSENEAPTDSKFEALFQSGQFIHSASEEERELEHQGAKDHELHANSWEGQKIDDHGGPSDLVLASESFPDEAEPETVPESIDRGIWNWRVRLRFHRADIYLGLAILVAAGALLWPTATSDRPSLNTWERVLITMGIAEAPPPAVHYHGDPNLKVWVDTHTALYYCPGDELYGKSSDGHYTTQGEAQADRFEPAERSACIVE